MVIPEFSDGRRNGVVQASVESPELIDADGRGFLEGQVGDRLAKVAVVMNHVFDGESMQQQFVAVAGRGLGHFRHRRHPAGWARDFDPNIGMLALLKHQRLDELLEEYGNSETQFAFRGSGNGTHPNLGPASRDQFVAIGI